MAVTVKLALASAVLGSGLVGTGAAQDTGDAPPTAMRGCVERVEGGVVRTRTPKDTVVGPIGWLNLPRNFDPDQQKRGRKYGFAITPMKALAIVRAGGAVTVSVPRDQRPWMWLDYGSDSANDFEFLFRPCPRRRTEAEQREACAWEPFTACRSGLTQFNGLIAVDYEDAPNRGRCARLLVRVEGESEVRRTYAFGPPRGLCDPTGRSIVLGSPEYLHWGEGWGGARPARLSNGESPGVLARIRWRRWGGRRASGRGTARVRGRQSSVELEARRLGRCPGYEATAYTVLRVRKVAGGPWRRWNRSRSLCVSPFGP
jgi:hypothetical protein